MSIRRWLDAARKGGSEAWTPEGAARLAGHDDLTLGILRSKAMTSSNDHPPPSSTRTTTRRPASLPVRSKLRAGGTISDI